MDIEDQRQSLRVQIQQSEANIYSLKENLKNLEGRKQPKNSELYKALEDETNNLFNVEVKDGRYEHILGGDGRSRPWSEQRGGIVATITIPDEVFISSTQGKIIESYLSAKQKINHFEFIDLKFHSELN